MLEERKPIEDLHKATCKTLTRRVRQRALTRPSPPLSDMQIMKKETWIAVIVLAFSTFLVGCSKEVQINSVASSETIVLKSKEKNPTRIWLAFQGRIEGEAQVTLMLNGKPYRSEDLNGDIDFVWENDWYYNEAIIEYKHGNTKSGHLTIKYDF